MKTKLRRVLLASALLSGIVFSTYGIFARANANAKLANVPPGSPVKGSAKAGSAALTASSASGTATAKGGASTSPVPMTQTSYSSLADGTYVGATEYAYYGYVKVEVIVRSGNVADVKVLEHPNDNGTSRYINGIAVPYLIQEAVQAQNTQISLISGATLTSIAFVRSLNTALLKAASA